MKPHFFDGEVVTHYQVSIASKKGVKPWRPYLPKGGVIAKENLHKWLTLKMINAERAAMYAKEFYSKISRTYEVRYDDLVKTIDRGENKKVESAKSSHRKSPRRN